MTNTWEDLAFTQAREIVSLREELLAAENLIKRLQARLSYETRKSCQETHEKGGEG